MGQGFCLPWLAGGNSSPCPVQGSSAREGLVCPWRGHQTGLGIALDTAFSPTLKPCHACGSHSHWNCSSKSLIFAILGLVSCPIEKEMLACPFVLSPLDNDSDRMLETLSAVPPSIQAGSWEPYLCHSPVSHENLIQVHSGHTEVCHGLGVLPYWLGCCPALSFPRSWACRHMLPHQLQNPSVVWNRTDCTAALF